MHLYININLNLFIFINVQDMCMFFSSAFLNILQELSKDLENLRAQYNSEV